jgi:hypothetical protein
MVSKMRFDVDVEYDDLEGYQRALLTFVEVEEYDDRVSDRLLRLMDEVRGVEQVETALGRLRSYTGIEEAWPMLFSYDNFRIFYRALMQWRQSGTCPEIEVV